MADDEVSDEATLAETLGAFGARPLLDGTSEPAAAPSDPTPDGRHDEGWPETDESPVARVLGWVRWAAAPLGFFLFLSALTAYGLLRDREGSGAADSPAPAVATTALPATTATTAPATEVTTMPTIVEVPTTLPEPPAAPSTTLPPVTSDAGAARVTAGTAPVTRFDPVCGYTPGRTARITINGRPRPPVTVDAAGCVSVTR